MTMAPSTFLSRDALEVDGTRTWCRRYHASLAAGRYQEALDALRRVQRRRGVDRRRLALAESDALLGLARYQEAADVAQRALRRPSDDPDVDTRLRLMRGQSLWLCGRVASGRSAVHRAAERARAPLTRARAHDVLALMAWKAQDLRQAEQHVARAHELYAESDDARGQARALGTGARVERDAGRVRQALRLLSCRIELAATTTRRDALALAHHDRGALLTALGRWREAREELDRSRELFRQLASPQALRLVAVSSGALDLTQGELQRARQDLEAACAYHEAVPGDPRARAEALLVLADLLLAEGQPAACESLAAEALQLFRSVGDRQGESRGRLRRALGLLEAGRPEDALLESRRALRSVRGGRPEIRALAELTLGRVLLRANRRDAAAAFDRARALAAPRRGWVSAARFGAALARGESPDSQELREARAGLERWGDRRLLAVCLAEAARKHGRPRAVVPQHGALGPAPVSVKRPDLDALGSAAVALAGEEDWRARWGRALQAVRPVLPWHRVARVAPQAWQWRGTDEEGAPLAEDDVARRLAAGCERPCRVELSAHAELRHDPGRVLEGLGSAYLMPLADGAILYLDLREGAVAPDPGQWALVEQLSRLLGATRPGDEQQRQPDGAPPAFPGIVGRCSAMRELLGDLRRVAAVDVPVHIFGETGTGKERVARALHGASRRSAGPFVAVNAASIGDELFEAELFGHARGAFTGAVAAREGYVAEAEKGTLFIDEVVDLSPRAQAKLLRYLQEHEYRRLGETGIRRADVRIVSAANKDLEHCVAAGQLREDLMYRLNPVVLRLPPLRERGDDVHLLARHFVRAAAQRAARQVPELPAGVLRALSAYSWPGNIRELENEIQRLVALAGDGPLRVEQLSARVRHARGESTGSLRAARDDFEKAFVRQALARHNANRMRTAEALGITRQALLDKIKRFGL